MKIIVLSLSRHEEMMEDIVFLTQNYKGHFHGTTLIAVV